MNELEIINSIKKIIKDPSALKLNDDVFFDKKKSLVASIDTYNEKTHYMNFKYPNLIIKKAIRSSISDIISKGCDPKYLLISFTGSKKQFNKKNIQSILQSIKQEEKKYNFFLVGGDTTLSNKSSFTICTFGYSKKIVKRNNSLKNDDIYLTGNVGDASVGLEILKNNLRINKKFKKYFIDKFFKPELSFGFHRELLKFATSSMDISLLSNSCLQIGHLLDSSSNHCIIPSLLKICPHGNFATSSSSSKSTNIIGQLLVSCSLDLYLISLMFDFPFSEITFLYLFFCSKEFCKIVDNLELFCLNKKGISDCVLFL